MEFYEGPEDAVRSAIKRSGKSLKEVACHLWPAMSMESARSRISDALSESGKAKLDFGEVLEICRFTQQYDPLYFLAYELNHSRPTPVAPKDKAAALIGDFNRQVDALGKLKDELMRLNIPDLKAVV